VYTIVDSCGTLARHTTGRRFIIYISLVIIYTQERKIKKKKNEAKGESLSLSGLGETYIYARHNSQGAENN
jgi:hypothetical protein